MFGIGLQELLLIMVVALIVLGPQRLPEVAKSLGKFYREIKGSIEDVKSSIAQDISSVKDVTKDIKIEDIQPAKKEINTPSFEDEFDKQIKEKSEKKEVEREKISFKKDSKEV
ncbi:MAG: Sec-independent protein translocase protein TatB [Hydrogenothermaceae bacterium]|nr:Sec-independent protein translocase protein TatB [Hydrogenothermaceae bacterium]